MEKEFLNKDTGELIPAGKLNEVIFVETRRPNGSLRIQQDFSNCPTLAEQHTAHLTNLNYLIERYKPDELAAYMHARSMYRTEILGHDFSVEPNLQEAKNWVYKCQQAFDQLPDEIQRQFRNHLEFLKFIDNPANAEKMRKMGILTAKQIEELTSDERVTLEATRTTTQEEDDNTETSKSASLKTSKTSVASKRKSEERTTED